MKNKTLLLVIVAVLSLLHQSNAQSYDYKIHKLELDEYDTKKGWHNYGGFINDKGNYVIKFGKAYCDVNVSKSISIDSWAGSQTTTTMANFNGMGFNFHEVEFDKNFGFIGVNKLNFPKLTDAFKYQNNLYGKKFKVHNGNINRGGGAAVSAVAGAFKEGVPYLPKLNSDFMNTIIVAPSSVASVGVPKTLISSYVIATDLTGNLSKFGNATCSETPAYYLAKKENAREEKGQVWMYACNHVYPGGGVVGYYTQKVVPANGKVNVIFKKYDETLQEIAKEQIDFDFKAMLYMFQVKNEKGNYDYIIVAQGSERWGLRDDPKGKPEDAEIIYMDGITLKPLYRTPFKLKYSLWLPELITDENNNIYIMGNCAADLKNYAGSFKDTPQNRPNFQMMKYNKGEIEWYNTYDRKAASSKTVIVTAEGVKQKASNEVVIYSPESDDEYEFIGNKLLLKGQETPKQVKEGKLYMAIINLQNGELEKYYVKAEEAITNHELVFSKNNNEVYWVAFDFKPYNKYDGGYYTSKHFDSYKAGKVYIAKINLDGSVTPTFTDVSKEQWVIEYGTGKQIVSKIKEGDEILFQGRTLTKKQKDSKFVFISVKK